MYIGVQIVCAVSYDIILWCTNLDTHQTSTEQTCGHTDQNGKTYAQHHIQGQEEKLLGQEEDESNIYCITCYFRGRKIARKVNLIYFRGKIFSQIYCSGENYFPPKYLVAKIYSR